MDLLVFWLHLDPPIQQYYLLPQIVIASRGEQKAAKSAEIGIFACLLIGVRFINPYYSRLPEISDNLSITQTLVK